MPTINVYRLVTIGVALLLMLEGAFARADEVGKVVLVVGNVLMAGTPLQVGDNVKAAVPMSTGSDGYLYIKTVDNGFLILRPNTVASVVAYRVDPEHPAESRFKIELQHGVARSISGDAVKNARQNFRFNTPVAAIGVRGTDFTAYADAAITRVAVLSGGVVVSSFGGNCTHEGGGPCEGSGARELFAGQPGHALQVAKGGVPQLIKGNGLVPDAIVPPRKDEPVAVPAKSTGGLSEPNLDPIKANSFARAGGGADVPIQWGRWQPLAEHQPTIDLANLRKTQNLEVMNLYYALLRPLQTVWENPAGSMADFQLQGADVVVRSTAGQGGLGSLENGRLRIDFSRQTFSTGFDLLVAGQRFARQAEGRLALDGKFDNVGMYVPGNNIVVSGVLGRENGLQAAYVFQSRLDDNRVAYGAAIWGGR